VDTDEEMTEEQVADANEDGDHDDTAEPLDTDDEEAAEEDTAPEPDGEPDSFALVEAHQKEWDRVRKYLAKNLGEIEGDNATHYLECPWCNGFGTPGFVLPEAPPVEVQAAMMSALNIRPPDEYQKDNYSRVCDSCNGLGETRSGSKVPGRELLVCFQCKGNGWVAVGDERGAGLGQFTNGVTSTAAASGATPAPSYFPDGTEPPEVADLREKGYIVMPPVVVGG